MSHQNSREEKREVQYSTHNRKPGAARYWKESNNRRGRRWASRVDKKRAENFDIEIYTVRNHEKKENKRPIRRDHTPPSRIADILSPEQLELLRKFK